MNYIRILVTTTLIAIGSSHWIACSTAGTANPQTGPVGEVESTKTKALEAGARTLQTNAPVGGMDIYVVGFHPMKHNPSLQMEAHHYCRQVNEDFAQCALFDGNGSNANLNGIEYIISKKLYDRLPAREKKFWHPHNYEILSGQLVAPGLPEPAEKELMRQKMNSYGKTWHVWQSNHFGKPGDKLPLGEAMLAWSFTKDGQVIPEMVQERDRKLGVRTDEKRRSRADLSNLVQPESQTQPAPTR